MSIKGLTWPFGTSEDADPAYGAGAANEEGTQEQSEGHADPTQASPGEEGGQPHPSNPTPDAERLREENRRLRKQNRDKDRHISNLEGQIRGFREVQGQTSPAGDASHQDINPADIELDEETRELFEAAYEEDPDAALEALGEYIAEKARSKAPSQTPQQGNGQSQQIDQSRLQEATRRAEVLVARECKRAIEEWGEPAKQLVNELYELEESSELGQAIARNPFLAAQEGALYEHIGFKLMREGRVQPGQQKVTEQPSEEGPQVPDDTPAAGSVETVSPGPAADRQPGARPSSEGEPKTVEDQIGEQIVNAGARDPDRKLKSLLTGKT